LGAKYSVVDGFTVIASVHLETPFAERNLILNSEPQRIFGTTGDFAHRNDVCYHENLLSEYNNILKIEFVNKYPYTWKTYKTSKSD
jgi:hypothetical protein